MAMAVTAVLVESLVNALEAEGIEVPAGAVHLERPARPEHGDWSSNAALALAKSVDRRPRDLAEAVAVRIRTAQPPHVEAVEVAGPGFVNFRLRPSWLHESLRELIAAGEAGYARPDIGHGERVQIEFISANPTGPMHLGNGWFGCYGDALARIMDRCDFAVAREFYVNDTGGQIRRLGESLLAIRGGTAVPEGGYQGAYMHDLAAAYDGPDDVDAAGRFAVERNLANIRATTERLGIRFDAWYSQASIEESGKVEETIEILRQRGLVFEEGGAVWLRTTEYGDGRDRVLVKANGDATYFAGDLAYHRDKFLVRGFDRVIDVFGADHHGQVASLEAGVEALGVDRARLEVKIGQLISLVGGRMSKRSGNFVSMDSLVDDLGPDVVRLLCLVSSIDQAATIDVDKVRADSRESPVFYLQYAHARIAGIDRVRRERGIERRELAEVDLGLLLHPRELDVARCLDDLPGVVEEAAVDRAPHKVTTWVRRLAADFHGFHHDCRILDNDVDPDLAQARLWLVEATRIGLAIGLDLLGVSAPDVM
jgi:arginyl-tRNA synthetase